MIRAISISVLTAVVLGACNVPHVETEPTHRPNIVFIMADDLGYGDLACYGNPETRTPEIDRLAREGVRFTNFYANGPECSPTRTALMTGRYQHRVGGLECAIGTGNVGRYDDAVRLRETNDLGLPVSETSIARFLKRAGYDTVAYGKWHLGYETKFFPIPHGFDEHLGPMGGGVDYFHHTESTGQPMYYKNGKLFKRDGYMTDLIADDAVKFLRSRRNKTRPFFLYVPYTVPHNPYQGPNDRSPAAKTSENWNDVVPGKYREMVERMDHGTGRILRTLREERLEQGTLVVFCSDNGANNRGRNLPMSGFKGGLMEGGIHVPCIVRWPGVLPEGGTTDRVTLSMDLTVSIANAVGIEPSRPWDGVDILNDIAERKPNRNRNVFWRQRRGKLTWRAVRSGDMKYVSQTEGDRFEEHVYDLKTDVGEAKDLKASRPEELKRLKGLLADWEKQMKPAR